MKHLTLANTLLVAALLLSGGAQASTIGYESFFDSSSSGQEDMTGVKEDDSDNQGSGDLQSPSFDHRSHGSYQSFFDGQEDDEEILSDRHGRRGNGRGHGGHHGGHHCGHHGGHHGDDHGHHGEHSQPEAVPIPSSFGLMGSVMALAWTFVRRRENVTHA